ncbi:transglycosylase domain-containing protein [Streptomyces violascens]|uniref:Carboxypeptidase n=1 Tax=Streptomyces violascens TaxID=67381 RepID=A0ABQ3QEI8_9ACTN|nr:transglycosylase domain-containing protein [Streptomyces violascens]GGU00606.1 carboxypeptidase [Streptomyces violascens]GHI35707.1 carboxypeptidase [Streptomyces violascens]
MAKKRSGGGLTGTQQAAKFLGVSVLAGAVLAGIALPAAGALGLAAKGTVEGFDEIPANLKTPPLSQRTTILDNQGGTIAQVYSRDRTVVPLADISPYMQKAIVAIEDSRFYEHGAIDLKGVLRAMNKNATSGGVAQGASTLTQQYVKNVFVEEAGDDPDKVAEATQQTIGRKVKELKYAIQVEEELGKKKILENYLNITFFGQQAYGIEAAAKRYFSKSAKDLTLDESAMLAGIVQSPSRYDPVNDAQESKKRRNTVLQRMADMKDISQAEADKAMQKPIKLSVSKPKNGCITAVEGAGFFCDYVREVFLSDPVFGKTKEERAKLWNQGGLTVQTTLDPQAQKSTQESIKNHVYQKDTVATAVSLVQPGTGKVLAMGQSKPYGFGDNETQINFSVNRQMGGSNYGFPVGSTFKPFLAAAAIEGGKPPTQQYSAPYEMDYPASVQTCNGKPWVNDGKPKPYHLENENESEVGPFSLRDAMAKSVNTYFVQMLGDIGMCPVSQMTDKLHVLQGNGDKLPMVPSALTLGSTGISPLTMASAYATFANRGTYCTPIAIESIKKADGSSVPVPKSSCSQAMSQNTADSINSLLRGVIDSGTGQEAGLKDRDNAGKTGTTDARKNAWFVGYTSNLSAAVWVGSPSQRVEMNNITIGGQTYEQVYGGQVPGPIWRDAMTGALQGQTSAPFVNVNIPDTGQKPAGNPPPGAPASTPDKSKNKGKHKPKPGGENKPPNPNPDPNQPFPGISLPPGVIGGDTGGWPQ